MIAVIDYDVGNLYSLKASLSAVNVDSCLTRDPNVIHEAEGILLPGVGAFGDAADQLKAYGLDKVLKEEAAVGKPFLGICLGMQLLFEKGYEFGLHEGLGLLKGSIKPMADYLEHPGTILPHMGWNDLIFEDPSCPLLEGIKEHAYVYFVHSYFAKDLSDSLVAYSDYEGILVPAMVQKNNVYGAQFHPEKSGQTGLQMLRNFDRICQAHRS